MPDGKFYRSDPFFTWCSMIGFFFLIPSYLSNVIRTGPDIDPVKLWVNGSLVGPVDQPVQLLVFS